MSRASCLAVVVLLLACAPLSAPADSSSLGASPSGTPEDSVRSAYGALRDAMYNSEPLQQLETLYGGALDVLAAATLPSCEENLWRSRIEYVLARGYQACRDKQQAAAHYEQGLAFIKDAQAERACSEGWRMMSEHISQLCLIRDLPFLLANGLKVLSYAERALGLDSKNAGAQIIVAASKVYPPPIFGGNPRTGIELMRTALAMGTAERDDLFNIYAGLGLAYGKLKNAEEARLWFAAALALYPGNAFVRTEYEKLDEPGDRREK